MPHACSSPSWALERELHASGFNDASKIYAVYYDGTSTYSCGGGAWPPLIVGNAGALYLRSTVPGFVCYAPSASHSGLQIMDFAMLHELMHTLGFVPTCAPHHTRAGHVSDSPTDLMYAGDEPWRPSVLDVAHDDYYAAHIGGCPDFAESPFLERRTVALTVTLTARGGAGSVTSAPPGIACPPTCTAVFPHGASVRLAARPLSGSRLVGWGGACSGTAVCTVALDTAKEVSAVFGPARYRLTVLLKGKGRVTSTPSGLACPRRCSASFDSGTRIALRPRPARGWRFARWSGACSGRGGCSVLLSRDRTAAASFVR